MENNLIMEKRILFTTIIASIMLCACAKEIKTVADDVSVEKVSTATTEETASEESLETSDTSEKCIADYNSYDELIGDIKKILDIYEAVDFDTFFDKAEQYGWFTSSICGSFDATDKLGYIQVDIDGDGVDELLLGTNGSEENSYDVDIDGMFTIRDGKVDSVFLDYSEREFYNLYEDGVVEFNFYCPPDPWGIEYYKYNAGNLELIEGVSGEVGYHDDEWWPQYYYYDSALQKRELTEKEYDEMRDELEHKYNKPKYQLHLFREE